jgi:pyruvate-formate lyase-activating enzyme
MMTQPGRQNTRARAATTIDKAAAEFARRHLGPLIGPARPGAEYAFGYVLTGFRAGTGLALSFSKNGAGAEIWILPAKADSPCYRRTKHYSILYRGTELDDGTSRLIEEICARVARRERAVPGFTFRRPFQWSAAEGLPPPRHSLVGSDLEIRVTMRCNEMCPFCNVDVGAENFARDAGDVERAIASAPEAGARRIVFTGGEPTLMPELPRWVRAARELGLAVCIQTNGVVPSAERYWERFRGDGGSACLPDTLFMSFHTTDPRRVGRLTGVPGTFRRKVASVTTAKRLGIEVMLNFVITSLNASEAAGLPGFVAKRLGSDVPICFSFVAPAGRVLEHPDLVPRMSSVAAPLARAFEAADRLGIGCWMTDVCGMPPCILPSHRAHFEALKRPEARAANPRDRVKPPSCRACVFDSRCVGVWKAYADHFGLGELAPVPG